MQGHCGIVEQVGHRARPRAAASGREEAIRDLDRRRRTRPRGRRWGPIKQIVERRAGSRMAVPWSRRRRSWQSSGKNVQVGDGILAAGEALRTAVRLAALAACGIDHVHVGAGRRPTSRSSSPAPSTPAAGEPLAAAVRVDGLMLAAGARAAGAVVERPGATKERWTLPCRARDRRSRQTWIITCGGVSVGPHDLVRRGGRRLRRRGGSCRCRAMQPGRPLTLA